MAESRNTTSRKEPSQDRSKKMVEKIFSATRILLINDGVEGVTTGKIAKQAGISVGSLYQYFPNKLAVLKAMYQSWLDEVISELEALSAFPSMTTDQFLAALPGFLDSFYSEESYQSSSDDRQYELELVKGMRLFKELQEIDDRHQERVAEVLADGLEKVFTHQPREKLIQVGIYLYYLNNAFDELMEYEKIDPEVLLAPHKEAIIAVVRALA